MTDGTTEPAAPYRMATIAKLTTISPQRLRSWERRYDLLRPKRGPGGHRLYGREDLMVLRAVRQLLDAGRSIGEINDIGRDALLGRERPAAVSSKLVEQWIRAIVEATLSMDDRAIQSYLDGALASLDPEGAIEHLVIPAQQRIGSLWASGQCTIASEHMATGVFVHRLRNLLESEASQQSADSRRVLCACLPGERHELGLLAVSYSLAIRGARITMLGIDVPFADLYEACVSLGPRAVLLSVSSKKLFEASKGELLDFRERLQPTIAVVLGGNGVPQQDPDLHVTGVTLVPSGQPPRDAARSMLVAF